MRIQCRVHTGGFKGFAVGEKLTIADLVLANEVEGLRSGRLDGIETSIVDKAEALVQIAANVKSALA